MLTFIGTLAYFYYFYFTPPPKKAITLIKNINDTGLDEKNESERGKSKINMNMERGLKETG